MDRLLDSAVAARNRAQAQFSRFRVGAALLTKEDRIFTGCNIENASYGLTLCAERVAIFKAVSEGFLHFTRLCVVADTDRLTPPCGACRQIIWEFCGDIPILMANLKGDRQEVQSQTLLPFPFDRSQLAK